MTEFSPFELSLVAFGMAFFVLSLLILLIYLMKLMNQFINKIIFKLNSKKIAATVLLTLISSDKQN